MTISVKTVSGMRAIQRLRVMHFGELRTIRSLKVMDNGNLRLVGNFYGDVSVNVTPSIVTGTSTNGVATTSPATANVTGGLYPYTYQWTLVSDTVPGTPIAVSPTQRVTTFRGQTDGDAVFKVTVTDSLGSQGEATVTANFVDLR
jgi:hypothetical protein